MNIFHEIAAHYSPFGICLLNDEDGSKIDVIEANYPKVEKRAEAIFKQWHEGTCTMRVVCIMCH